MEEKMIQKADSAKSRALRPEPLALAKKPVAVDLSEANINEVEDSPRTELSAATASPPTQTEKMLEAFRALRRQRAALDEGERVIAQIVEATGPTSLCDAVMGKPPDPLKR
jgi:hypothetical protein